MSENVSRDEFNQLWMKVHGIEQWMKPIPQNSNKSKPIGWAVEWQRRESRDAWRTSFRILEQADQFHKTILSRPECRYIAGPLPVYDELTDVDFISGIIVAKDFGLKFGEPVPEPVEVVDPAPGKGETAGQMFTREMFVGSGRDIGKVVFASSVGTKTIADILTAAVNRWERGCGFVPDQGPVEFETLRELAAALNAEPEDIDQRHQFKRPDPTPETRERQAIFQRLKADDKTPSGPMVSWMKRLVSDRSIAGTLLRAMDALEHTILVCDRQAVQKKARCSIDEIVVVLAEINQGTPRPIADPAYQNASPVSSNNPNPERQAILPRIKEPIQVPINPMLKQLWDDAMPEERAELGYSWMESAVITSLPGHPSIATIVRNATASQPSSACPNCEG